MSPRVKVSAAKRRSKVVTTRITPNLDSRIEALARTYDTTFAAAMNFALLVGVTAMEDDLKEAQARTPEEAEEMQKKSVGEIIFPRRPGPKKKTDK